MNGAPTGLLRLFLAIWPGPEVGERIEQWRSSVQWRSAPALVPRERLHLTLHFIGNVPASGVDSLRTSLHVIAQECSLRLEAASVWQNGIAALTPLATPAALERLHNGLAAALQSNGMPVQERPWRPHVTLARKAGGARLPPAPVIEWPVDASYDLVRSVPGGGYEVVHRYK
jgi:2'-5' RNA ligase